MFWSSLLRQQAPQSFQKLMMRNGYSTAKDVLITTNKPSRSLLFLKLYLFGSGLYGIGSAWKSLDDSDKNKLLNHSWKQEDQSEACAIFKETIGYCLVSGVKAPFVLPYEGANRLLEMYQEEPEQIIIDSSEPNIFGKESDDSSGDCTGNGCPKCPKKKNL
jgi:hypothetical protein